MSNRIGSNAVVRLSCESFESELFDLRVRRSADTNASLCESDLSRAQVRHLTDCTACRRDFEEGALTGTLGALVASGDLAAENAGVDRLFLPGVLAAVRAERPPIRQRERRLRQQWFAGAACALVCLFFVNLFILSQNDPAESGVPLASEPASAQESPDLGDSKESEFLSFTPSSSGDEFLLGYAAEYLPCEFIPSGESPFGGLTEVKF